MVLVDILPSAAVKITDTDTDGDDAQPKIIKGSECWKTWLLPKIVETNPGASKAEAAETDNSSRCRVVK